MPLPLLMRVLPDVPPELVRSSRGLRARSTVRVYLRLVDADVVDANWMYVYPPEYRLGRVTAIDEWLPAAEGRPHDDTVMCIEYRCDHEDATWSLPDADLAALAADELVRTGLVGAAEVIGTHVLRLRATHPVPARGHRDAAPAHVESVEGVSSVGRHGKFGVPGVGACMEAAFETADLVLTGHDERTAR